jgi:hypothetical protein
MARSLELATQIAQGTLAPGQTRTTTLLFHAQGENSFGARAVTAEARVVWEEVGSYEKRFASEVSSSCTNYTTMVV